MRLNELADLYQQQLGSLYDQEEVHSLFLMALKDVLGYDRSGYLLNKQLTAPDTALLKLNHILHQLSLGTPIQYVLGHADFFGLQFKVTPAVLIPRPETEELVDWILTTCNKEMQSDINQQGLNILDVGTGSGCIAIALKKHLPKSRVSAIDVSTAALAVAKENALLNNTAVTFIEDDILQSQIAVKNLYLDIVVSNPPYIKEEEKTTMHENVLDNEPHLALFVSNQQPLIFYEAIADFAHQHLKAGGRLFFEINAALGKETLQMLHDKGFADLRLKLDMQGKERMISAIKPAE